MASEILGLFTSPEEYQMRQQQAQQQMQQNRALQFAQLNPFEKASYGIYQGAGQLGSAGARLFGGEDPQLRKITRRQQILTGAGGMPPVDLNDPQSMIRAAKDMFQFDPEFSQGLIVAANELTKNMADIRSKTATAARTELTTAQEEKLRDELSKLGSDATEKDLLAVVSKYGDPSKIMALLQSSQMGQATREARREEKELSRAQEAKIEQDKIQARKDLADAAAANKKEAADLAAKNQKERDAAERNFRLELEAAKQSARKSELELAKDMKGPKTLSASLQKSEDADLVAVDNYDAQLKALESPIKNLTPDAKTKKPLLALGPVSNFENWARNKSGFSSTESRAYEQLQSAIDTAVNLQVSAEKGVQTDKDVLRFANALIAASGKNDTKATQEALTRFYESIKTAKTKTQGRLESRRKSQGVDKYYQENNVIDFSELR